MRETDHDRRRDELAAYLLGALESGEAADLERHLAGCERCREELDWLRPALQALPESIERIEPSPALRDRVMAEAHGDLEAKKAKGFSFSGYRKRFAGGFGSLGLNPATGLAVLALVMVAVVGGYAIRDAGSDGGATTAVAQQASGVEVEMVREGDSATLRLARMGQAPADKVMQVWVRRGTRVTPARAALFRPDADGSATVPVADMEGVDAVMISAEPRGGSTHPTSAPIVNVAVPQ